MLLATAALAQDTKPAKPAEPRPDPMEAEVESIHTLGAGQSGRAAIDKFFAAHANDPRVLSYLPSLESDLRRCLFRLSGPQPSAIQLLGRGATKYEVSSGRAEFRVEALTEDAGWLDAGEGVRSFDALFDGDVSVEMPAGPALDATVLLGFDSETRGAYVFVPVDWRGPSGDVSKQLTAFRFDPDLNSLVNLGGGPLVFGSTLRVRYAISKAGVIVEKTESKDWGNGTRDARTFADTKYRRGFVAVKGGARFDPTGLTIVGRLDPVYARRQIAEADARRFRDWRSAKWDRVSSLPKWVLGLEAAPGTWANTVPSSCPESARVDIVELQRAAFESPSRAKVMKPWLGLAGAAADWQDALFAFAERRYGESEAAARKVMSSDPAFAGAWVLAGRCLLARGADESALPLFEEARRLDAKFAPAIDGLALAAFRAGDTGRMHALLADETAAGVSTLLSMDLRRALLRLRRGPDWKKRFDGYSTNFVVSGDTSIAVCNDTAKILEEASDIFGRQFRRLPRRTRARVRVFSGFESYADYVSDLGADPSNTLGMYLPNLRELCIYLHEDRPELSNTIRHEGFHQYIHDFIDDVPIWFDEGFAEYFGFSRRERSKARVGQVGEQQELLARAYLPRFSPLDRMFLMEPEEFMAQANVHYVESWAVVHMLRETVEPSLKGVLDRYVDAIFAGRSQRQAYCDVLAPVVGAMEAELRNHVNGLRSR